jgi:uncharacterized lipoprotein YmbA
MMILRHRQGAVARQGRQMTPRLLAVVLTTLIAGCASSPPSSFYTLTPIPEAERQTSDISGGTLSIGIGPVVFPQFLDRPQLVMRDGTNRLTLKEFNRWGGTVQDDFLRVWGENLTYLLDTSRLVIFPSESRMPLDFRITAEVVSFEGRPDGEAVLKARWAVMDERLQRALASREDVYRCPIAGADSAAPANVSADGGLSDQRSEAVVAAMSDCLGRFSRDVASVVRALPIPAPREVSLY